MNAQPPTMDDEVRVLASMPPLEYDLIRHSKAKALGVRISTLDDAVIKARPSNPEREEFTPKIVEDLEPHPEPVDGPALVSELAELVDRHVSLPSGVATALALWVLGTYLMEVWRLWPKILITSPEKRCGKSVLLETLEAVIFKALMTSGISASAITRCISAWGVALLIDEADTFTKDNDGINGVINAGHTRRGARIIKSAKMDETFEPEFLSVWGAQVIAGIGAQRGTLHDRSIQVEMKRKLTGERKVKIPQDLHENCKALRAKCLRWAIDNADKIKQSSKEAPQGDNDREQDNWTPLFRIAETVGGNCLALVGTSHGLLVNHAEDTDSPGLMLLKDLREVFVKYGNGRIASAVLVSKLIALPDRPWAEWRRGNPLTPNTISKLLAPYGIRPKKYRGKTKDGKPKEDTPTFRGYEAEQFKDAFKRYIPPVSDKTGNQSGTPEHVNTGAGLLGIQSGTQNDNVPLAKTEKPARDIGCSGVPFQNPENRDIDTNTRQTVSL